MFSSSKVYKQLELMSGGIMSVFLCVHNSSQAVSCWGCGDIPGALFALAALHRELNQIP